jgi:hypothetical protein
VRRTNGELACITLIPANVSYPKSRNKTRDRRNAALGVANERRFFLEERHPASDSESASEFRTVT